MKMEKYSVFHCSNLIVKKKQVWKSKKHKQSDYLKGFKQTPKSVKFTLKRKQRLMVKLHPKQVTV